MVHILSKNGVTILNKSYNPTDNITMMKEDYKTYSSNIEGLEDVRIFAFKNKIHFTASCKNITNDGNIVIVTGEYDHTNAKMDNIYVIQPPRPSGCEKNWIFVPESVLNDKMNFIYGWHPLEIGSVNKSFDSPSCEQFNKLEIHTKFDTPAIFSRFRGSSTICEHDDRLWCVVHFVKYSTPRVYYHSVVQFNRKTMKPEMYSLPFVFRNHAIEYCLGFNIKDGKCCFIFSQNDNEPGFITLPIKNFKFCLI